MKYALALIVCVFLVGCARTPDRYDVVRDKDGEHLIPRYVVGHKTEIRYRNEKDCKAVEGVLRCENVGSGLVTCTNYCAFTGSVVPIYK